MTHKDFQPYKESNGTEPFPFNKQEPSSNGYTKDQHRTVPSQREAYSMFPNLAMSGYKNKPPVLHTLKRRDPIAEENNRDGPAYHSTEHHTQYTQKKQHVDTTNKAVGVHEDTGFTRAKNVEPVTHYPEANHEGHQPTLKSMINPAVPSIMKTSFQPYVHGTGKEKLNDVSTNSNHDTGFTRFIQPTGAHTAAKGKVKVWNIFFFNLRYCRANFVHHGTGKSLKECEFIMVLTYIVKVCSSPYCFYSCLLFL